MKVIAINDDPQPGGQTTSTINGLCVFGLTLGKIYDAADEVKVVYHNLEFTYRIVDDNGLINWYNDDVLMPLEKYRELKLNELGI